PNSESHGTAPSNGSSGFDAGGGRCLRALPSASAFAVVTAYSFATSLAPASRPSAILLVRRESAAVQASSVSAPVPSTRAQAEGLSARRTDIPAGASVKAGARRDRDYPKLTQKRVQPGAPNPSDGRGSDGGWAAPAARASPADPVRRRRWPARGRRVASRSL